MADLAASKCATPALPRAAEGHKTLPASAPETYTPPITARSAVQSNSVYPTPCTLVPSINFSAASDKRYSFRFHINPSLQRFHMFKNLLITALVASSSFGAIAQSQSARALVEDGASAYLKDGATAAINVWLKGSALEGNTQATSQANTLRQIEDFYGKPESYETISESTLSAKSKLVLFVINYQRGPLYARFQVFQLPSGKWVSTEFKFQTEAANIFPAPLLYERK